VTIDCLGKAVIALRLLFGQGFQSGAACAVQENEMSEPEDGFEEQSGRRDVLRAGAKLPYIVPIMLAAMKATEQPILAASGPPPPL